MHDREQLVSRPPELESIPEHHPALFYLEATHHGERMVVAQGVVFPESGSVVIDWRGSSSIEYLTSANELYEKVGSYPRVLWWNRETDQLTEAEPDWLLDGEG